MDTSNSLMCREERRSQTRIKTMYTKKVVNSLALIAALIVLFGVSTAANLALADNANTMDLTLKTEATTTN